MAHLIGKQVMLREYRESDYEHMRAWVNNPKIVATLSDIFLYPHSEKGTRKFLDMAMSSDWKGFVIAFKDTQEYIGQIDLIKVDQKNGWAELGIVIGYEEYQNRGYGTEALKLLCEFAFDELRLNRVELVCWSFNVQGRRAYEKVGFVQEGVRRQKRYRNGEFFDEICYGLLKEEWEARK
ncbi:MAG: GNAT family N-acetyltransferase [Firmicutes bacterium]|mgnify:CR=1 FL=1|nr:GNAT family N-acetyltransferase [Bacillota bacterium]